MHGLHYNTESESLWSDIVTVQTDGNQNNYTVTSMVCWEGFTYFSCLFVPKLTYNNGTNTTLQLDSKSIYLIPTFTGSQRQTLYLPHCIFDFVLYFSYTSICISSTYLQQEEDPGHVASLRTH